MNSDGEVSEKTAGAGPVRRLIAYLQLIRPGNVIIATGAVLVGALSSGRGPGEPVWLACLVAGLITAGGNVINDVYDLEIDRINKPSRTLPSGRADRRPAAILGATLLLCGVIISPALGWRGFLIALAVALLLVAYSARLKGTILWGNLAVSAAAGLAFVYGGIAARRVAPALIPAGFAFLFHLGREILKDAQDVAGDRAEGARTLPAAAGVGEALGWAGLFFILLIAASPVPFLAGWYSLVYLIMVALAVDLPLIWVMISWRRDRSPGHLDRLSLVLKLIMCAGLAAILAGVWL
jgi:geranylgeranylglycerol-phosphate geranylgeranyltransferase